MSKLQKFFNLSLADQRLFIWASGWIILVRMALRLFSFRRVRQFLIGRSQNQHAGQVDETHIGRIVRAVDTAGRLLIQQRPCLTTALVAQMMLARQGYRTTLRIGVARESRTTLQAHAWLECDGQIVIGLLPSMNRFTPLPPLDKEFPVSDGYERLPILPGILGVLLDFAAADPNRLIRPIPADWEATYNAVVRNGLLGIAYWYLSQKPETPQISLEFRHRVIQEFRVKSVKMAILYQQMFKVFNILNANAIDYVVVKGPAVAYGLYPDPVTRIFNDLDIVVHDTDWSAIHQVLIGAGFEQEEQLPEPPPQVSDLIVPHECKYVHPQTNFRVEVHYDDLLNAGLRSRDVEGYWQRAQTLSIKGMGIKVPSLEDQLIHLCAHAHYHGYTRMSWFTDLTLLVRDQSAKLDWSRLLQIVQTEDARVPVYYTLVYLNQLFNIVVPECVLAALRPDLLRRWLHEYYMPDAKILNFQPMPRPDFSFYFYPFIKRLLPDFLVMGRRREKLRCLLRFLLPSGAWLRFHYEALSTQPLWVMRLVHPLLVIRNYARETLLAIFRPKMIWEDSLLTDDNPLAYAKPGTIKKL